MCIEPMSADKPSSEETKYWENVLRDHKLTMGKGRRNWLSYGHEDREQDSRISDNYAEESKP